MGLNRTALRLATVEALAPFGATEWPTLARNLVFDSEIGAFNLHSRAERFGFIRVTTEESSVKPAGTARDLTGATEEHCLLAIEFAYVRKTADPNAPISFETDRRAVAELDRFDKQVRKALSASRASGGILAKAVIAFQEIKTEHALDSDNETPLSMRRMTIECRIPSLGDEDFTQTGIARLPSPLRQVAMALPEGSDGLALALALSTDEDTAPGPVPLETLGLDARLFGQAEDEDSAITATITL